MPEEINRMVTDRLATRLFIHSEDALENLLRESIPVKQIDFVGNTMIDTLVRLLPDSDALWQGLRDMLELDRYILVTLHRPSNVDDGPALQRLIETLETIGERVQVVFPVHPRTRQRMSKQAAGKRLEHVSLIEPLGYLEFLALEAHATAVITDSGGVQEETTYLGVPCLTVRENTERPVTVTIGTNALVGQDPSLLMRAVTAVLDGHGKHGSIPPLWDGKAAERIADVLV
jgi:UDP-N-acetylglucosamine 2-epimerase (non-hydrolysing)